MTTTANVELYRGDTHEITVTVTDSDGSAFDLTSYTMKLSVKKNKDDDDSDAIITDTAVIATPATGIGVFSLTVTDTNKPGGTYYWDVQINNSTTDVKTVTVGTFQILEDVTKTAS